jgi:AcrR family transcriptional regulator
MKKVRPARTVRDTAKPAERGRAPAKGAKPARTREARSAERRGAILMAALDEFSARGFEMARIDDVAKRAGIAKGTVYLYFRDKETLFQELVREMLAPLIGGLQATQAADLPADKLAEILVDLFVREIYETRRKDVIRLMITEGRRFPKLAEFYYREVLSHIFEVMRGLLKRASAHGPVPPALIEFPQLMAAPAVIAIIWNGLFDRFEPLDVRKMLKAHIDMMLAPTGAA